MQLAGTASAAPDFFADYLLKRSRREHILPSGTRSADPGDPTGGRAVPHQRSAAESPRAPPASDPGRPHEIRFRPPRQRFHRLGPGQRRPGPVHDARRRVLLRRDGPPETCHEYADAELRHHRAGQRGVGAARLHPRVREGRRVHRRPALPRPRSWANSRSASARPSATRSP